MTRRVILDSNLLLLYAAGLNSRHDIAKLRQLQIYAPADFDLLVRLLGPNFELVLTPNSLTETSNLLRQGAQSPENLRVVQRLRLMLERFGETYLPSLDALNRPDWVRLGVSDAVLLILNEGDALLITADLDLWRAAVRARRPAINFNHERDRHG